MTDQVAMIDPQRAALLVMDYQVGIVGRFAADGDGLIARMAGAIALARANGMAVGYVRVAFVEADYDALPPANKTFAAIAQGRMMHDASPETAVDDRLAPQRGDIVVRKTRVGAFSTTDLHRKLQDQGIDTLVLAGISTSGVVLSTVRDAADRDYRLFVLADACADPNAEAHAVLTEQVFPRQADVITTTDLPSRLLAD